jgi:hypothetical protein
MNKYYAIAQVGPNTKYDIYERRSKKDTKVLTVRTEGQKNKVLRDLNK